MRALTSFHLVSAILVGSATFAEAATIEEIENIQKTKNPIAALMLEDHKCNLIAPPSAYMITATKPGAGGPGGIFIPRFEKDGMTYNFDTAGKLCPLPHTSGEFPVPLKDGQTGRTSSIGYRNEITASPQHGGVGDGFRRRNLDNGRC